MTKTIFKYSFYAVALLVLVLWAKGCFTKAPIPSGMNAPLLAPAIARVSVSHSTLAVQTKKGVKAQYVPSDGDVTVTITDTGEAIVNVKHAGFTFHPEIGLMAYEKGFRGAVGFQLAYWNRLELHIGAGFPHPVGFAAVGYRLDQVYLNNTSAFVSYGTDKSFGFGLLTRF